MAYARAGGRDLARASRCSPRPRRCCWRRARGAFAGCISATANLNADLCARAFHGGDAAALDAAVTIRKLFDGKALVPGVKALLAHIHRRPGAGAGQAAAGAVPGRRPGRR